MIDKELLPIAIALGIIVSVFLLGFFTGVSAKLDKITDEYEDVLKSHEQLVQSCMDTMEGYKKTIEMYKNILRGRKDGK